MWPAQYRKTAELYQKALERLLVLIQAISLVIQKIVWLICGDLETFPLLSFNGTIGRKTTAVSGDLCVTAAVLPRHFSHLTHSSALTERCCGFLTHLLRGPLSKQEQG